VKAARPVLNGGREETCRKVTRLAPTQLEWVNSYTQGELETFLLLQTVIEVSYSSEHT
jgi:hypothetical protein